MPRVAVTVLPLALLAGTTTAFALTEALKLERSPVSRPRFKSVFSPTCACPRETARLAVTVRDADTIDAVIVDEDGNSVRTLAFGEPYGPGRTVFRWDGRDDRGEVVPDGAYRLRLHFAEADRTIVIPDTVRVDTRPPTIDLVSLEPRRLERGGEGTTIVVRLNGPARPLLLADGDLVLRGSVGVLVIVVLWVGLLFSFSQNGIRIAVDHPVAGVGVGGFEKAYRERVDVPRRVKSPASHNTPVTGATATGVVGLALFAWLVVVALGVALRGAAASTPAFAVAKLAAGLGLTATFVHSLFYAAFFEDPLTWGFFALVVLGESGQAAKLARLSSER